MKLFLKSNGRRGIYDTGKAYDGELKYAHEHCKRGTTDERLKNCNMERSFIMCLDKSIEVTFARI